MKIIHRSLSRLALMLLFAIWNAPARSQDTPVTVTEDANTVTLDNGVIKAVVKKANANLFSLQLRGLELLSQGQAYWNVYGKIPGQQNTQEKPGPSVTRLTEDPAKNGGRLGEVALRFHYTGHPGTVPLDIEIRYALESGDSGLYGWTLVNHEPTFPVFNIEVSTVCLKLNPQVFDFLSADSRRQREMPTGEDWVNGQELNLKEARRMTTGIHKGEAEHKYDYAAIFAETPAYGWSSSSRHTGIWIVNPNIEYINGGPAKAELTGHIDVKPKLPADPTLLFVWHGPHYGGRGIQISAGERWNKVVGPFLIYCNSGGSHEELWKDALARATREQLQWPYDWAQASDYPHAAERGSARGQLIMKDSQAPSASAARAWVGLAASPYPGAGRDVPNVIDWQTDGKYYQYWARADDQGRFDIRNARPGTYTLYAYTDGVLGDFSQADVHITAGKTVNLGQLIWKPVRYGRQLWDIGIPNRSAEEFRHGDHYWQWGLYQLYPQEFPNDVNFVVGNSDWRRDWNYAQPPRPDGKGGWTSTTWRIQFDMAQIPQGTATLRLAICGARGGPVDVSVNGHSIGSTGELPESGVMHRDGIRGTEIERNLRFNANLLIAGKNVIELKKNAHSWVDGVLYDYVRLEVSE
jgi:rhamnogalacturonan endolyase